MATITVDQPRLVGFGESTETARVVVDSSGTNFAFGDLVTYASTSGIDKATSASDVAAGSDLALAAEPDVEHDAYYEPITGNSFGDGSGYAQVILLHNQQLEMSTYNEALATADLGSIFALTFSGTTPVVNLSTSSTSGFKTLRVADPVFGGDVGDTNTRVIGTLTDDMVL
jgi:hypothetical protein